MSVEPDSTPEDVPKVFEEAQKQSRRSRVLRLLAALVLLSLVGYLALGIVRPQEAQYTYTTTTVRRGDLVVIVNATGEIQPLNQVDVGTEVSGTIETVDADFNDQVKAGQVLARLDTETLEAKLRQSSASLALAEASVGEAAATVTETQNRLRRTKDLIAKRLSSQEELDTVSAAYARAEAGLKVAEAKVDQARAQLDADRRSLEKAIIRSPIDGIVLERKVEPGQTVAATLQTPVLFTLAEDLRQMQLHIDVDEADVGQVSVDQRATFLVDAFPGRVFPAKIKQVRFAPRVVDGVVTYRTLLSLDNSELLLRPGMTATAEIVVARHSDVLLVPNAALRFKPLTGDEGRKGGGMFARFARRPPTPAPTETEESKPQVWTLVDGRPQAVDVTLGASDGVVTELTAGVTPGMTLLTDMTRVGG